MPNSRLQAILTLTSPDTGPIGGTHAMRIARLIEFDPLYCDVIVHRFEAFTGNRVRLAETGATFEDVAEARISVVSVA